MNMILREKILDLCKEHPHLSFTELQRMLPETKGKACLAYQNEFGTVVLWVNLSLEAAQLLYRMNEAGDIHFMPCSKNVYLIDGTEIPNFPIPTDMPPVGSTQTWWTPCTINAGKTPKFLAEEAQRRRRIM